MHLCKESCRFYVFFGPPSFQQYKMIKRQSMSRTQQQHKPIASNMSMMYFTLTYTCTLWLCWIQCTCLCFDYRYYSDIKSMPAISDHDMNATLAEESRQHRNEFNNSAAMFELYQYVLQYLPEVRIHPFLLNYCPPLIFSCNESLWTIW